MQEVSYNHYLKEVEHYLINSGLFLTAGKAKVNTMVIGWGGINVFWNKPVFLAMVRKSRYTHELIEKTGQFTVSVPLEKDLKEALGFCGTHSGRNLDKFKECNLTPLPGLKIDTPVIAECPLHYECRVIYKQDMLPENLDSGLVREFYPQPDYHTFYVGEIVACYLI